MQVGDYITGIDRSYQRTIYVIEEIISDGMQARCWARYYDGHYFYRNDKHNLRMAKVWLNEFRLLGRNDYPETVLAKAQFLTEDEPQPRLIMLDVDDVLASYEGLIVRSDHPGR